MAKPFALIEEIVTTPIAQFADQAVGNLSGGLGRVLLAGATLYVIFFGIQILRGQSDEFVMDLAWRAVKIVVIAAFVTNVGLYKEFVMDPAANAIPKAVQNAFMANQADLTTASPFDKMTDTGGQNVRPVIDARAAGISFELRQPTPLHGAGRLARSAARHRSNFSHNGMS